MTKKKASSQIISGVSQPETTSKLSAEKIKVNRLKKKSVADFVSKILEGNSTFLSHS